MKKPEQASVTQSPTAVPSAPSRRTRGAERDVDPYLAVVGRRIREIRTEQSLTQAELAVKAGLQVTTIFSVENGLQYLTLKTLLGIARSLGVEPADLLPSIYATEGQRDKAPEPDRRTGRRSQPESDEGHRLEDLDTVLAEIDRLVQLARTMRTRSNPYGGRSKR